MPDTLSCTSHFENIFQIKRTKTIKKIAVTEICPQVLDKFTKIPNLTFVVLRGRGSLSASTNLSLNITLTLLAGNAQI